MTKYIKILFLIYLLFVSIQAAKQCHDIENANSQDVWQIMKMSTFDRIFLLTAGTISIILLILTGLSWLIFRSFSTPSDIMFAIVISQLIENSALLIQAGYFTQTDTYTTKPSNFDSVCFGLGIMNIFGNVLSIYYNLIFCIILAYSIQKTLKGFLFNRFRYHLISFILTGSIILIISLTQGFGRGLNGVCGFRVASKQSTARFVLELIISAISIFLMVSFKRKLPKNQFFGGQLLFKFYFYYMGFFVATQIISSISYLVSDIMCKVNTQDITAKLHILYSISIFSSISLSYLLIFMRLKHPLLIKKLSKLVKSKDEKSEIDNNQSRVQNIFSKNDENQENQDQNQSWLGCLLQSLKGSQILSFLEGITISFIQKERKYSFKQLSSLAYKKNYIFSVSEQIVKDYIQRRISSRQSFLVHKKLGGLVGLDYQVTSYCPQVFSSLCTRQQLRRIIGSLDIKKNIKIVKKQSHMNGGKSGQLFFGTFDNRLIFKSIRQDQALAYLSKLKQFTQYFKKEEQTLIVKILGIFKFVRNDIKEDPIYLILMENITLLPKEVNLRVYDIKGSQFNRSTIEENRIKDKQDKLRRFTLKDKDFKLLQVKIKVDKNNARDLKRMARKDIQFLSSLGFMDYSLIIIKRQGERNSSQKGFSEAMSLQQQGVIYNFGIIDYLQSWTLKRKAERVLKTLVTNQQVTADSPSNYSNRLCEFIDSIL